MPFLTEIDDGTSVNGGQMNEIAGDFYGRVSHKADGDQYFGTGNTSTQKRPRGSVSVGVNSGLIYVDTNSGVLYVGTNTPKGQLKVAYNGRNGPRPMNNDTTSRNRHDSALYVGIIIKLLPLIIMVLACIGQLVAPSSYLLPIHNLSSKAAIQSPTPTTLLVTLTTTVTTYQNS